MINAQNLFCFGLLVALSSCSQDASMQFYGPQKKAASASFQAEDEQIEGIEVNSSSEDLDSESDSESDSSSDSEQNANDPTPTPEPTPTPFFTSTSFQCNLDSGGSVKCWGSNQYGQLGTGSSLIYVPFELATSVRIGEFDLQNIKEVKTENNYACAINSESILFCWGSNLDGQMQPLQDNNQILRTAANIAEQVERFHLLEKVILIKHIDSDELECRGLPSNCAPYDKKFAPVADWFQYVELVSL